METTQPRWAANSTNCLSLRQNAFPYTQSDPLLFHAAPVVLGPYTKYCCEELGFVSWMMSLEVLVDLQSLLFSSLNKLSSLMFSLQGMCSSTLTILVPLH